MNRTLRLLCALVFLFSGVSYAAGEHAHSTRKPCADSVRGIANATHARINACVVARRRLAVATTYYQNASKVGGTALAAYPEMTVRYGVLAHTDLFVDVPSDVAQSGEKGAGVFYFTHPGFGIKTQVYQTASSAYDLSAETEPQLDAMAHLSLLPQAEFDATGQWALPQNTTFAFQSGALVFRQRGMGRRRHTASIYSSSLSKYLTSSTSVTVQLRSTSIAAVGSSAQSSGTVGLGQQLGSNSQFRAEIGTAFNAAGRSKAHYIGAGFTFLNH